ncbi:hypothetical protein LTR22_004883 [Elasticomyces elasticus]|nr:hypothetical protein LTR22_004883 [Elasticomyces elasticus]KAK4931400.1 hypothetical protein LTR49_002101 [Elasticomyces elasticus]
MAFPNYDETNIEDSPQKETAVAVDSHRPPQFDKVACRSRHGCACACSRDRRQDDGNQLVADYLARGTRPSGLEDGGSVNGEEGLDDEKIEVGDLGPVSVRVIKVALAKHQRCTCDVPMPTGYSSPGFVSDGSMLVEQSDDGNHSMAMSTASLPMSAISGATRSTSPGSYVRFMGGLFELEIAQPVPHHYFTRHEAQFCLNMDIGLEYRMLYPEGLSIGDSASSGHSEYDMW